MNINYCYFQILWHVSTYWSVVWQNALGCFIASVPAILISWLIFYFTLSNSEKTKKKEQEKNDKERLDYFKYLLKSAYSTSKEMEVGIKKFIDDIGAKPFDFPDLTYRAMNGIKRLSELQAMDEVLFAFTKKHSNDENAVRKFEKIINLMDFLHLSYEKLSEQVEKGQGFHHNRQLQVAESIYRAHFMLTKVLVHARQFLPMVQTALVPLLLAYQNMAKTKQTPLGDYVSKFLKPINTVTINILNSGAAYIDDLNELQEVSTRGIQVYNNISIHNNDLAVDIQGITYKKCATANVELKELIDQYL